MSRHARAPQPNRHRRLALIAAALVVPLGAVAVQGASGSDDPPPPEDAAQTVARDVAPAPQSEEPTPEPPVSVGLSDEEVAAFVPALKTAAPGTLNSVTLTMPDGQERRYLYSVPVGADPQEPLPVLLAMGGWTDPPENFLRYAGFDTSAAASEAVVVYPAGVTNAWAGAPYSATGEDEDISFLRAVIAQLETALPIDRDRVTAVGMSNGGGMALELACHAPDLVAGVAAVSGAFYEGITTGCRDTPVATQIIHGTDDELLNYGGGVLHDTPYLPVEEVVRWQGTRNGCSTEAPESTPLGDNSDRLVLPDCTVETEHIRVNGGFHDWYIDPSTPDETWEFLSRQHAAAG
ncbi:alpha/beta hydrolase family esterase [Corynebacterium halotolerans]|uniref:Polyhydroxybutyrate depolymerase n=1 Tax=Corynebacterium halotolerans YIM 70093 = DSM 44683 TaxID=1121362 RepID=M1MX33_9CORY|nr:alpha/beta hydrolase-fold protein [Corynebacterium halotolerans]AGF72319.1 polyhydroxybutyrate depolymerase [Corynebacterium halotolerans YIM 70093 = DSM 44683]